MKAPQLSSLSRLRAVCAIVVAAAAACDKSNNSSRAGGDTLATNPKPATCAGDNGGLILPAGFCATVFADSIGHARHVVVNTNGDVYVNTWSGDYYNNDTPHSGGFIVALRDTNNDGRADVIVRFGANAPGAAKTAATPGGSSGQAPQSVTGPSSEKSGAGGTGIGIYKGHVYVEEGPTIVKYPLPSANLAFDSAAQVVLTGLPLSGDHPMHPFAIDTSGALYVDLGSATNSCQVKNRTQDSPGRRPCTELATRGGIWRYDANKTNQRFSTAERYATGIRNAEGLAFGPDGALYSTQHGRDQLYDNWPKLYTPEQGENLPAEELMRIQQNADYGWPMCYFDNTQQKLVLAPEYGGDGKARGDCASKTAPLAFFPAHWAPNDLLFYTGKAFPAHYRGGAFIAFHGSWNRAPGPQGGYQVAFVPFNGGNPVSASQFEKFADGFAGGQLRPDIAAHRPSGLTQGQDGALYITDDKGGRVWRVVYTGQNK
ncbi:MAG TPA: PQQ-dependent sugar dehydrogenase [Gemmatimonadaceae bacterium]|jgi:glucose/arabinose dehydrogenase